MTNFLQPALKYFYGQNAFQIPAFIHTFLPSLLLMGVTGLLPVIISWSVRSTLNSQYAYLLQSSLHSRIHFFRLLGYWSRSRENHKVMTRTFWYLWFSIVAAPTFGLTSGLALIEHYAPPLFDMRPENSFEAARNDSGGVR